MRSTDIVFYSQLEYFFKCVDRVLSPNGIAFIIPDVVVGG